MPIIIPTSDDPILVELGGNDVAPQTGSYTPENALAVSDLENDLAEVLDRANPNLAVIIVALGKITARAIDAMKVDATTTRCAQDSMISALRRSFDFYNRQRGFEDANPTPSA